MVTSHKNITGMGLCTFVSAGIDSKEKHDVKYSYVKCFIKYAPKMLFH